MRTFKALVKIVEQDADERIIAKNALVYACQTLPKPPPPFGEGEGEQKTLKQDVDGVLKQTKRPVVILGRNTPKGVICDWIEPSFSSKARVVEGKFVDEEAVKAPAAQVKAPTPVTKTSAASKALTSSLSSSSRKRGRAAEGDDVNDNADRSKRSKKLCRTTTVDGRKGQ
jgi:hypothetical protein